MASIRKRKRSDGSYGYTAQIRLFRDGQQVYQESQAFERLQAAKGWSKRRETELAQPGAKLALPKYIRRGQGDSYLQVRGWQAHVRPGQHRSCLVTRRTGFK